MIKERIAPVLHATSSAAVALGPSSALTTDRLESLFEGLPIENVRVMFNTYHDNGGAMLALGGVSDGGNSNRCTNASTATMGVTKASPE